LGKLFRIGLGLGALALLLGFSLHWAGLLGRGETGPDPSLAALRKKLQESQQDQSQLRFDLAKANENLNRTTQQLQQVSEIQARLQEQLTHPMEKSSAPAAPPVAEIKTLQEALSQSEKRQADLKDVRRQVEEAGRQAKAAQGEGARWQGRATELEQQLKRQEKEVENFKRYKADAAAATRQMERRIEQLTRERQQEMDRLRRELSQLEADRRELTGRLEAERLDRKEFERMKGELAQANERIAELILALDTQEQLTAQRVEGQTP